MQETLAAIPEATVEIDGSGPTRAARSRRLGPRRGSRAVRDGDRGRPAVSDATCLDVLENARLYRAEWPPDVESIGQAYLQTGATMVDVAETLDITQQALSKRLRRAHGNLVSNALTVEELEG